MKSRLKWSRRAYAALAAVIIITLCITFWRALDRRYALRGDVVDLYGYYMAASGYDTARERDVTRFAMTGEDPQFILSGMREPVGGIRITFGEAWTGAEPLPVQVFYAEAGGSYEERRSVKSELKAGERELLIPVPLSTYETLRFDINGDFSIEGIDGCTDAMEASVYVSPDTVKKCAWQFPLVIIVLCLIFWAHGVRIREEGPGMGAKGYLKSVIFGAEPSPGREEYLDYMRVLAAVLVILAHACSPMVTLADADWKRLLLVCGLSLGLCCNLLYVMLSGTLLLSSKKEEGVGAFYVRRASKVIIPLIAYYLLLLYLNGEVSFFPPKNIGGAFKRIVTGAPDVGPHLWLIYTIVALYLVTPFFRVMVQHMSDRLLFSLAAVILVLNALTTYLPLFGMAFGASTFLAGWEGVFLLGYIMTRQDTLPGASTRTNRIIAAAVVSYMVMAAVVFANETNMNYVYNCTPPIVIASCGIFALFLKNRQKLQGKLNPVIRLCSKYSYSIILIHWYALFVIVQGKMHLTALRFGCVGGIPATVAATFLVCIVMAVIFDNTVVIVCNVAFDKAAAWIGKKIAHYF